MGTGSVKIVLFHEAMQKEVESLIIDGLTERWGVDDPTMNSDIREISKTYSEDSFYVAVANGAIVGTGAIVVESTNIGRIVRMSVAHHLRHRGIGKSNLRHLEKVASGRGYKSIVLETTETWTDAIGFYKSQGYIISGYANGDAHFEKCI